MGRFLGAREIVLKGAAMSRNGLFGLLRFALAAALILVCGPALAEKRVALVLGDSAYQHAPSLTNPANDAALIAKTLKDAGFDVVDSRQNLSAQETRRALREFSDEAADADIAVVYFAGHGLELDGVNYLIPGWVLSEGEIALHAKNGITREALEKKGESLGLGRHQTVDDAAWAALYLLSDESEQVTGTTLHVDAGASTLPIPVSTRVRAYRLWTRREAAPQPGQRAASSLVLASILTRAPFK